jgi:multiple sugar transport system permease protein
MKQNKASGGGKKKLAEVIILVVLIIAAVYFLFPLVWLFIASSKSTNQLFSTSMFSFSKDFYRNLLNVSSYQGGHYWRWYLNSIFYSGITALLGTLISALAGYALAMYQFPGNTTIRTSAIVSLIVPASALTLPTFLLLKFLGLMNSYAGVILPGLAMPFGVFFLYTYIKDAMPKELIDSGRMDGVGEWNIFFRIALPIIRPGLVTLLLISFIFSWNSFFLPLLILNDPLKFPLTLGINYWVTLINAGALSVPPYAEIIMGSFLSILPMLILFPFFGKQIASGLASGSVKE